MSSFAIFWALWFSQKLKISLRPWNPIVLPCAVYRFEKRFLSFIKILAVYSVVMLKSWDYSSSMNVFFCNSSVGMQPFPIPYHPVCFGCGYWSWQLLCFVCRDQCCLHLFFSCAWCGEIQHRRWVGRAAVFMYQYSKRTLSETTASPVGPSARQSLFMDAEHASCHLVSSLLSFGHVFSLCTDTNPCLLVSWIKMSAVALKVEWEAEKLLIIHKET